MSDASSDDAEGKGPTTPLSLLERARARDEEAWTRLVVFWCGRSGVPAGDVEDVAQEVFTSVARHLVDFRRDRPGDTFQGWLRVLTRNQVLLFLRRNQGRAVAEGGSAAWQRLQS